MERNVYDDCWQLLQSFGNAADACQDARFELFSESWLELQMQHIYSAQTNNVEVIETTLAALHVGKRVACGRRTYGEVFEATRAQRIGGIYLMYAIYNKQPTKDFVKIEVSPRTWQGLTGYVEQLRREDTTERRDTQQVSYILWRLVREQAFRYTALDYCQALDALAAYDSLESIAEAKYANSDKDVLLKLQRNPSGANLKEKLHGITELIEVAQPLCQLEAAYNKQMQPHRGSFAATNIFSQLRDLFGEINNLVTNDDSQPTCSNNVEPLKRRKIRDKAMYGDERERMISEEEPEDDPEPSRVHERRMSSATVFHCKLPEDVLRDLES